MSYFIYGLIIGAVTGWLVTDWLYSRLDATREIITWAAGACWKGVKKLASWTKNTVSNIIRKIRD